MQVFYSAAAEHGGAIDYVHPETGNGMYSGETPEQLKAKYPDIVIVSESHAVTRTEAKYTKPATEITEEQWWEYLECMPPCKWGHCGDGEAFHLMEHITHSIVMWCVRISNRYYRLDDTCNLSVEEVVARVKAQVEVTS